MEQALNVIFVGGPTVILEIDGLRIMTDPTLDPAGTAFPNNEKPDLWKLAGPAIADVGRIDAVLLSHDQHNDNLDNAGKELLKTVPVTITTKPSAQRLGNGAIGLAPWETTSLRTPSGGEIIITATPARHGPHGVEGLTGEVTGFVLTFSGNGYPEIYLTGDTVFFDGIEEVAKRFKPRYVFAFAGAARAHTPFNLTMGTNDALDTAAAFPEATIIPLHIEGWSLYTEHGVELKQAFKALGIDKRLMILQPGVKTELQERLVALSS